jgi:hypothetical protein
MVVGWVGRVGSPGLVGWGRSVYPVKRMETRTNMPIAKELEARSGWTDWN